MATLVAFFIWGWGVSAANGPAFSTGPVNQPVGNFIREAISTLVVPEAPRPIIGNTVLWVGMGTSNGDLIQGINNNYPKDTLRNPCSNLGGNWCVAAYTLSKKRGSISGPRVTSRPGDKVTMHYKFNDATGKYDQKVSVNGIVKSSISTDSGRAQGWGTALECTTKPCGQVPAHSWINTTIILDKPSMAYQNTHHPRGRATGAMRTADNGRTWRSDRFSIPTHFFPTA